MLSEGELLLYSSIGFIMLLGLPSLASALATEKRIKLSISRYIINALEEWISGYIFLGFLYLLVCISILFNILFIESVQLALAVITCGVFLLFIVVIITAGFDKRYKKDIIEKPSLYDE